MDQFNNDSAPNGSANHYYYSDEDYDPPYRSANGYTERLVPPPPPPPDYDYEPFDLDFWDGEPMPPKWAAPTPKRWATSYDLFDWKAFTAEVEQKFDVAAYVAQEVSNPELLRVDPVRNRFYYPADQIGGGPFQVVCFKFYHHTETQKHWSKILKAAAHFAGVPWPNFKKLGWTLDDTIDFARRTADSFRVIVLEEGEYLSQKLNYNDLAWGKPTHIMANCGFGKTRAADNVELKSFYAPMTRQALTFTQSAQGRGAAGEVVCEGYIHEGQASIFATYDGARKEIELIKNQENPLDVSRRTAFIDEIQHMTHDAFRKGSALDPLLEVCQLYLQAGGRIVTLSGTPSPILPYPLSFEGSDVIHVIRKNATKRTFWVFRQSDPIEAILNRVAAGYTHVTYSIDDREKCEYIASKLNEQGIKALPIHSQNKTLDFHKSYASEEGKDGEWALDVVVYVTTRATVDGFNVLIGDKEGVRVAEMFDSTLQYGSKMVEQRGKRVRDVEADLFVGMSDKALKKLGQGGHFDLLDEQNHEIQRGHVMFNAAKALKIIESERMLKLDLIDEIGSADQAANDYVLEQFKGWVTFDEKGDLKLDELAIIQRATKRWVAAAHACPDIMINEIKSYGYDFMGLLDMKGDEEEASKRQKEIKQTKKDRKENELNAIKTQVETMSLVQAQIIQLTTNKTIREEGDEGKAKVKAAGLLVQLTGKGLTPKAARQEILNLTSTRKDKIERIESVIQQARIRRAMSHPELFERGDPKTLFFATLQDGETFKFLELLKSREMARRARVAAEACGIPEIMTPYTIEEKRKTKKKDREKRYDSDKKIVQLLGDMFNLKRINKRVDGIRTNFYEFQGFIKVELAPPPMPPTPPASDDLRFWLSELETGCDEDGSKQM